MSDYHVSAKPCEWKKHEYNGGSQWVCKRYGFDILEEPEEEPELRYQATWGEYLVESFTTLELAQAWCQENVDEYICSHAVVERNH